MAFIQNEKPLSLKGGKAEEKLKHRSAWNYLGDGLLWIPLVIMALIEFLPISWLFANSLRVPAGAYNLPPSFWPTDFQWVNYLNVINSPNIKFLLFFQNSLKIAVIVTISTLLTSSMAAFAFARLHFPGRNTLFFLFLATMMVPGTVILIPTFIIISRLGLINSHWALILPSLTSAFGIFMLRQQFMNIPDALLDAAKIDGAGFFRIFFQIMLPLVGPGLSALGILTFLASWNNLLMPLLYLRTSDKFTFPLAILLLQGYMGSGNRAEILAGIMISVAPVLLIFLLAQRFIIQGFTVSGLKG
ncbi:MAG: carbohydrate ABC transporter permease [Anaerolineaceae bacterium]|nr:carbohydrate ABC transporter permease [Anaerolineaceae bacterium]